VDPTGKWKECKQNLTWDDNCSVNLASQGHYTGVFIGTRVSNVPRQGRLCPRVPGLSPEYPHKGGLHTVIIEKLLKIRPVTCLSESGLRLAMERTKGNRADHLASVGVARRRRLRAKGSVFAFATTFALRGTSSTKSSSAKDVARWWRRCPRSKWSRGGF
jgi:hypothetical protein